MVADAGKDPVIAAAGGLDHLVACVVDKIEIVAAQAQQVVRATPAIDNVAPIVTINRIRQLVAGEIDRCGPCIEIGRQGLDRLPCQQLVADAGKDPVIAAAGGLEGGVPGIVDKILIVAGATVSGIGAGPADQDVVADAAQQQVVAAPTVERVVAAEALNGLRTIGSDQRVISFGTKDRGA